jgi:hypothetical protein
LAYTGEANRKEVEEYLKRPISKVSNPNQALKKSYDKSHLEDSKFQYIKDLKDIRQKKREDSISSHGGTDDEDFNINDYATKKKGKKGKKDG